MPVITVSRQFGAGGRTLAENVSRKFGRADYDTPMLYRLVLNTSRLPLDTACRPVCRLERKTLS